MNEILYSLGWILKGIELLIVLFWLKKFSSIRWKLFFGVKKDLASVQHHELYSCFLTAFCFLFFHLIASEAEQFLLTLEMDKVEKIQFFYTSMIIVKFAFLLTLFCLHLVRGCTFSPTSRICAYVTIVGMLLSFMQLIARGYYDYHGLNMAYAVGGWLCNFIAISALATYPMRSFKAYLKEKRTMIS